MENINLNKEVYQKDQYTKVIDTSFSQLVDTTPEVGTPITTVPEFFELYNELFFEIPKTGTQSHEELIKQSSEYIGFSPLNDQIQALLDEVTDLRRQLINSKRDLANVLGTEVSEEEEEILTTPPPPPPPPSGQATGVTNPGSTQGGNVTGGPGSPNQGSAIAGGGGKFISTV
ncbi:hypothetical protein [Haliea sp.]|uniref:hypothetical protein n=1 Tax=Haliea sp. TaxID=1932666 RepID=UPI00257EC805|nr:hypothetical protein [Haliea sp.]|tara:strand:+ start:1361 stop:1879 length:519 start_codon:yes stop_codon:yes gene_type:complete